ncbi:unnamed protein product [Durusdinium trenchii]|uniref:Uncharacterized protein n=2 Tax=Durusdinium trenchii TaxID=1381693 RepID=A0ABP0KQU7_9DINO
MGQLCGPGVLCDLDKVTGDRQLGDEATRKVDQLALELRILKDENYRIREEQLRLEKELKQARPADREAQGRGRSNQDRRSGDLDIRTPSHEDQQLLYMKEVIRSLQAENSRLKKGEKVSVNASSGVTEEEYRRLEGQLRMLQRQHGRMQAGSTGVSTAVSGVSTPLSSFGEDTRVRALASRYEALHREQEELRNKVRRLARG